MEPKGTGRSWAMGKAGDTHGWKETMPAPPRLLSSPSELISLSLQMRPQKHKEKMLHHIQAAGPLPHSHPSPWYPCLQPPRPTHLGCLRRAEPSRAGSGCCWHHPTPHPRLGLWVWAGTLALDCPYLGLCPLDSPLESWGAEKEEREHGVHTLHRRSSRRAECAEGALSRKSCGASAEGSWARHSPSRDISAASGQDYFRGH